MMGRVGISGAGAVLLALTLGACTKGTPAVYVPNVTHVNGIPVEDYKPKKSDRRKDMVLTVADPMATAAASAPVAAPSEMAPEPAAEPAPATTTSAASTAASSASAASTVASAATTTASTATSAGSSVASGLSKVLVPIAGVITPAVIAAAEMGPEAGLLAAATFVGDRKVEVAVVDADTLNRVGVRASDVAAAGPTAVRVTGAGLDSDQALQAYSNVCEIRYEDMRRWAQQGGRISQLASPAGWVLWIDVCPGLMKFVQAGR